MSFPLPASGAGDLVGTDPAQCCFKGVLRCGKGILEDCCIAFLSLNVGIWGSGNEQNAQTIIILVLVLTHSRTRNVGAT